MKRWIAGAVTGLLVVLVGPVGVASAVDPGPAEPLATEEQSVPDGTGTGNQTDPHLSGSLLAFTSIVGTSSEIRYADLADGSSGVVPNGGNRDSLPDVDGDHIVFRRVFTDGSTTRSILAFDVTAPDWVRARSLPRRENGGPSRRSAGPRSPSCSSSRGRRRAPRCASRTSSSSPPRPSA